MSEDLILALFSTVNTDLCGPTLRVVTPRIRAATPLVAQFLSVRSALCVTFFVDKFHIQILSYRTFSIVTTHRYRPTIEMVITTRQRWCAPWSTTLVGLVSAVLELHVTFSVDKFHIQILASRSFSIVTTLLYRPTIEMVITTRQRWCAPWSTT